MLPMTLLGNGEQQEQKRGNGGGRTKTLEVQEAEQKKACKTDS